MNEYLDILDKNGNQTGKRELRTIVHQKGLWHRAVFVAIINSKNQILLQKRGPNKDSHPNCWDISVGGHIPAGMNSLEAADKELEEELGIKVDSKDLQHLFSYKHSVILNDGKFLNNSWYDLYLLKKDIKINEIMMQVEELSEIKWFDINKLKEELNNKNSTFVQHKIAYPKLFNILTKIS